MRVLDSDPSTADPAAATCFRRRGYQLHLSYYCTSNILPYSHHII